MLAFRLRVEREKVKQSKGMWERRRKINASLLNAVSLLKMYNVLKSEKKEQM